MITSTKNQACRDIHNQATVCCPGNYTLWTNSLPQWMRRLGEGLALGMCLSLLAGVEAIAATYSFTKIADTRTDFPSIVSTPKINDSGTVVFVARPVGQEPPLLPLDLRETDEVRGVYTGNGEQITEIVNNDIVPSLFDSQKRPSQYFILPQVDINNNGTVAFSVASLLEQRIGIFTALEGNFTNRSTTSYDYLMTGYPSLERGIDLALNNQDDLVYKSVINRKSGPTTSDLILSRVNQPNVTIAAAGSYIEIQNEFADLGNFAFNNQGIVTFGAQKRVENTKVLFTSDGSSRTTVLEPIDYTPIVTNDLGDVLLSNKNSILLLDSASGSLRTLADTNSGIFQEFLVSTINNNRHLAFTARLNGGGIGIFTGTAPTTDKVIASGDSLFGSTVTGLSFLPKGLNNKGQIAFFARLADGTQGIYRADPVSDVKL